MGKFKIVFMDRPKYDTACVQLDWLLKWAVKNY